MNRKSQAKNFLGGWRIPNVYSTERQYPTLSLKFSTVSRSYIFERQFYSGKYSRFIYEKVNHSMTSIY